MIKNQINLFATAFLTGALFLTGCKKDDPAENCPVEWGYGAENGPANWELCYSCVGQAQSPINVTGSVPDSTTQGVNVEVDPSPIHLLNNGHTLEFEYNEGSKLSMDGNEYDLKQFHFHTPSEHQIDGQSSPMEIHMVHKMSDAEYAVISVMVEVGASNDGLAKLVDHLPQQVDSSYHGHDSLSSVELLPPTGGYYRYEGSLTTPGSGSLETSGCLEIVSWIVAKDPITATQAQITAFAAIMGDNNRPVQALNGRVIKFYDL